MHVGACVYACAHGGQRSTLASSIIFTLFPETVSPIESGTHCLDRLTGRPVSLPVLGLPGFLTWVAGDLNSDLHVYGAGALPIELSLQPSSSYSDCFDRYSLGRWRGVSQDVKEGAHDS